MALFEVQLQYLLGGTKKYQENLGHSRRSQCQDLHLEPPEYITGVPINGS